MVDASQGVEAQTLANVYMAMENDLEVIPVLNKVDLPHADVGRAKSEIEEIIGLDAEDADEVSAKTGQGVGGAFWRRLSKRCHLRRARPCSLFRRSFSIRGLILTRGVIRTRQGIRGDDQEKG